jgi:hypothetical protein
MSDYKTISDYNSQAHLELMDKQAKILEKMMQPTMYVTQKTLRDEFAMAALFGVNTKEFDPKEIASKAFAIADAMLEARK